MTKKLIVLGAVLAVALPILVHIRNVAWENFSLIPFIFPIFGLLAFTLLWLHSISGVFEERLREMFDFDAFVRWTALAILVSILLHPLLLLIMAQFNVLAIFAPGPYQLPLLLGLFGLILLLTYDVGKFLKYRGNHFFSRHWTAILIISNIGFILTFFHSLMMGSDLQSGFLRYLWIFYGITAILAIIYTYAIKPFLKRV
jgi:hypothetical protein